MEIVSLLDEQGNFLFIGVPKRENVVYVTFPFSRFCFALAYHFSFNFRHEDVGKCNCHFCTHCGSMGLEEIAFHKLERVFLKDKAKHIFKIMGRYWRFIVVKFLVCFAYCFDTSAILENTIQNSARFSFSKPSEHGFHSQLAMLNV